MAKEFKLPDIGEGIHEGEVVRWLVQEGDQISEDQPIAEVMTDKATVEITSPYTGQVKKLAAGEGATVLVGATLIVIDDGSDGGGNGQASSDEPSQESHDSEESMSDSAAAPAEGASRQVSPSSSEASVSPAAVSPAAVSSAVVAAPASAASGPVLATPATRRLARELGIELRSLAGSGPRGRITREDVENASGGHSAQPAAKSSSAEATSPVRRTAPPAPAGSEVRLPLKGLRKRIAEHMANSKRTAAHFTYVDEVDVTELVGLREQAKQLGAEQGVKVTYLPFIMKALVMGLKKVPSLNAVLDEERGEIIVKHFYNFGIAVDTPDGLMVPVVKNVDQHSVLDLASEIQRLATAAREQKASLEDLRGGTFTITNAGNIGGLFATPIINHPEVAILGVHKIAERPVVRDGRIEVGQIMYLSISIDHRVVDGADGARFMNEVVRLLQSPALLFLEGV